MTCPGRYVIEHVSKSHFLDVDDVWALDLRFAVAFSHCCHRSCYSDSWLFPSAYCVTFAECGGSSAAFDFKVRVRRGTCENVSD